MQKLLVDPRAKFARGLFVLFLSALPLVAAASGFQVSPTIAEVPEGTRVASFQLRNNGSEPVTVQVDLLDWSQAGLQEDRLSPATGVVVVPRIATISPGGTQLVRVALQSESGRERAYRLRLREVPPPPPPGFMGVRTLVEQLVPLFFQVSGEPELSWAARLQPSGELAVTADNSGARHLPLHSLRVLDARGGVLAERKGPAYVLAGQSTGWVLDTHARLARGDALRLEFISHGARREVALTLE
jgi:fimbrial chaperone protein